MTTPQDLGDNDELDEATLAVVVHGLLTSVSVISGGAITLRDSWDELSELANAGWEVGSHTRTHPHLPELDDEELRSELSESRAECEDELGLPCDTLAYPYGDVDERVVTAARAAGYRHAAALPGRWHGPRPLEWPRVGVYHSDAPWRFRLKASPLGRRLRALL